MKLVGFRPSTKATKKIDAMLSDGKKTVVVSFGQKGSMTYSNKTGVAVDSIHRDDKKRKAYLARHKGEDKVPYTPGWFAIKYLWS